MCKLPDSARAYLDKVFDWDNKGVGKVSDLEELSDLMTDDAEMKLLPDLEIPDEDMQKICADPPNELLHRYYKGPLQTI